MVRTVEAWSVLLARPDRIGPADDGGEWQWSEIPAVEGVRWRAVHQKDVARRERAAALPIGQNAAKAVVFECLAHGDAVDGDGASGAADDLAGKRKDVLHQRHAERQVTTRREELRERLRWRDHDEFADIKRKGAPHRVEPD